MNTITEDTKKNIICNVHDTYLNLILDEVDFNFKIKKVSKLSDKAQEVHLDSLKKMHLGIHQRKQKLKAFLKLLLNELEDNETALALLTVDHSGEYPEPYTNGIEIYLDEVLDEKALKLAES